MGECARTGIAQWYSDWLWAGRSDDRGFESRSGLGIFLFSTASRPVLGPTQSLIHRVPGAFSRGGKAAGGVKLTTHLHLV
jgi:hypothetical protein